MIFLYTFLAQNLLLLCVQAFYKDFLPDRNEYRKYKIDINTKDDLTAMKEVVYRRYSRLLKEIGKVFYLTASNQVIYERVKNDTSRPLLKSADPYARICALMKERRPLYENAGDVIIDTNSNDLEEVIMCICDQMS